MKDPNRSPSDAEAARQISQSQRPPDAESPPADALPAADDSPAPADAADDPAADSSLALGDVSSLPDSPTSAENAAQPDVFGQDVPDAFDGSSSSASIESGDDMIGTLDLQPWLSDSMDNTTDDATDATTGAEASSIPADSTSGEMPSFSGGSPPADPFAASPPPFTGPLVEVSPGVFVYAGSSMPWSTDAAAQSTQAGEDLAWLPVALDGPMVPRLADKVLQYMATKFNRDIDQKLESHTNEVEFIRAAQMRALYGR